MKKTIFPLLFLVIISMPFPCQATDMRDSILEIPKDTIFHLRYELELPANRNYILLGKDVMDESFNEIHQAMNDNDARLYFPGPGRLFPFNDYCSILFESYERTYRKCLERHRQYYSVGGPSGSDNVIINKGSGNTNVIINNNSGGEKTYGSYIGSNYCQPPDHTIAALLIDSEESAGGGIFRQGYEFKVKEVRKKSTRFYNILTIYFDHDVVEGIAVVTTHSLDDIAINQLQYSEEGKGKGFWAGFADVMGSLNNIAGTHFKILLPEKRYYE